MRRQTGRPSTKGALRWSHRACVLSRSSQEFLPSLALATSADAADPNHRIERSRRHRLAHSHSALDLPGARHGARPSRPRARQPRQRGGDLAGAAVQYGFASQHSRTNNGGDGSERIDLRGLGPQRTLVLLNGRRFLNGGIGADSSVDLTSIPVAMIDRVEVLTSDATAIYGADAVGGVVNIITRDKFHGLEVKRQSFADLA